MAVFDAVIRRHFSIHAKRHCFFLILHGMVLTHVLWKETFLYCEVPSSFLVNTVQTLSKSVYNYQSYWQKFRGTFFMAHCVCLMCQLCGVIMCNCRWRVKCEVVTIHSQWAVLSTASTLCVGRLGQCMHSLWLLCYMSQCCSIVATMDVCKYSSGYPTVTYCPVTSVPWPTINMINVLSLSVLNHWGYCVSYRNLLFSYSATEPQGWNKLSVSVSAHDDYELRLNSKYLQLLSLWQSVCPLSSSLLESYPW